MIDGHMLNLKEKASIEEFCLIWSLFRRNNYFDEKLNLNVLFEYFDGGRKFDVLMSMEL
jgi:hypothetical protein